MLHHHPVRHALRGAAAFTCVATLAAACSGDTEVADAITCSNELLPASPTAEPEAPSSGSSATGRSLEGDDGCDQVTYVTAFGLFGRDAFPFCGVERGFFAGRGIEVEIRPGSGTGGNLELLLGGQTDFALVDMVGGVLANGDGVDGWKAVAAIHQIDLSAWMTIDPDLQTVEDLEGRTIVMPPGGVIPALFPTYADLAGADPDQIQIEYAQGNQIPGLLAGGRADAIAQFVVGLPFVQSAVGEREVSVHPFSDVIPDMYGVGLAATDELIADDRDLVKRFREGLLDSLDWALDHPEACANVLAERAPAAPQPVPVARSEMEEMVPYVRVADTFGTFNSVRVAQMIATLEGAGAIPAGITPQDIVDFEIAAEEAQ